MKVKKIADITLENTLWWTDYNDFNGIVAEATETIDGGVIVYEHTADTSSKNITLSTVDDSGWISKQNKEDLQTLIANSLGQTFNITTIEDEEIEVRFRHELGNALELERIFSAYLCEYYTAKIYLARV